MWESFLQHFLIISRVSTELTGQSTVSRHTPTHHAASKGHVSTACSHSVMKQALIWDKMETEEVK